MSGGFLHANYIKRQGLRVLSGIPVQIRRDDQRGKVNR